MDLFQFFLLLLMLAVCAAAAVVVAVICAIAFAMLLVSILAISAMVGFSRENVLSGLCALFVQLGVIAGVPVGALAALAAAEAWTEISHHGVILITGGATGAVGGLAVALLAHHAVQMAAVRLPRLRLPRTTLLQTT